MKKILSVLMFLLLLPALFSVPAAADVIYEPSAVVHGRKSGRRADRLRKPRVC